VMLVQDGIISDVAVGLYGEKDRKDGVFQG
jgi:hypothetical protein